MYISELIARLENAKQAIGDEANVIIHFQNEETIVSGLKISIADVDDYELIIE